LVWKFIEFNLYLTPLPTSSPYGDLGKGWGIGPAIRQAADGLELDPFEMRMYAAWAFAALPWI